MQCRTSLVKYFRRDTVSHEISVAGSIRILEFVFNHEVLIEFGNLTYTNGTFDFVGNFSKVKICKYGSDPLKTYLPNSDIDITLVPIMTEPTEANPTLNFYQELDA